MIAQNMECQLVEDITIARQDPKVIPDLTVFSIVMYSLFIPIFLASYSFVQFLAASAAVIYNFIGMEAVFASRANMRFSGFL